MVYKYTSMKEVVGMVVRNTQLQDTSFLPSIHEWIFDAMAQLETKYSFHGRVEKVQVKFHKAKLPCGLETLDAVQYKGRRVHFNHPVRPPAYHKIATPSAAVGLQTFETSINKIEPITDRSLYNTVLTQVESLEIYPGVYYYTEAGYLNTSFEEGEVILYFQAIPVDEDNMPLIPDNQNFKNALYWYTRAMMIGAGWEDHAFQWEQCMQNFEQIYGPRAIAEVSMPSPDQMEVRVDLFTRFLPDAGYYENFFSGSGPEAFYDTNRISS